MMTYQQTLDFLYTQIPMFQREGATAYKPGLERSLALVKAFGNPHKRFPSVHIAGTNGKGSTAHTVAAVLQSAGYKTGLYTSPHLVDFRERIRVDGEMITEEAVIDFTDRFRKMGLAVEPSFFELTMTMAFEYFARSAVDVAVIEVGLGGRLDSTNIITPEVSVITNISFDHTALLGNTLAAIASEKAGIIKPGVPVVIGEADGDVKEVFVRKAAECAAPICFADKDLPYREAKRLDGGGWLYAGTRFGDVEGELGGDCQPKNAATVLAALDVLLSKGWVIPDAAVKRGFANVEELTGLAGRWMKVGDSPTVICDTGHNVGGWEYLSKRLASMTPRLKMVIGFVSDKDVRHILEMMPRDADYYFTQASIPRALPAEDVAAIAAGYGLRGGCFRSVAEAVEAAKNDASADDTVFIGGSTFVVGDYLKSAKGR